MKCAILLLCLMELCVPNIIALIQPTPLQTVKQWKLLSYNFEFNAPTNNMDFYNPQNVLITGLAVGYDRIFIATPRLFSGVPATLSSVSKAQFGDSPALQAYPNWSFHTAALRAYNCSDLGLVSVYRLRIDSCNRLWALDAGVSRSLEDYEVTCPPKILVFDLNTNQVVRRIDFPREVLRGESLFTNLIVDETTSKPGGNCDDVFVYISDTVEPAIVVYDSNQDLTWRVSHPSMYPDPDFAQSQIEDYRFVLMDGIVGLAFDDRADLIYFQPLASDRLFSVTKQVLRAGPLPINQVLPVRLVGKKSSQGIGLGVSPFDGSVIFSPLTETALAAWNPTTNKQAILAYDPVALQFVADMSLSRHEPGALYVISSKFHRFFLKNLNPNEINNRIMRIELPGAASPYYYPSPSVPAASYNQYGFPVLENTLERKPGAATASSRVYFKTIQQPYQYEPVGLVNRGLTSPFTALNQGEQLPKGSSSPVIPLPLSVLPTHQGSSLRQIYPTFSSFNDNRIRFRKSVNETRYN